MGKLFDMKWSLIHDIRNGRLHSTVDYRDRFDELIKTAQDEKAMCANPDCERPAVKSGLCKMCLVWYERGNRE